MIHLSGIFTCATEDQARIVAQALPEHMRLTRAEPGCIAFSVIPTDNPLCWQVEETFADRAAFDVHSRRVRASDWALLTTGIARDYVITDSDEV